MKFKYFQITENETLDHINEALLSMGKRSEELKALRDKLGAYEVREYNGGGVAYFGFNRAPDKKSWKKVKHGYMPKAKTEELKLLSQVTKSIDYRDIIKKYGFGHEMLIGEQVAGGTGFRMHSSYINGSKKTGFWAVAVPYQDEFDREVHTSLVEIKEWEMMKGIDSSDT